MKKAVEQAIDTITGRPGNDWFIILEDPRTEKFVQFLFDETDGLIFDLPLQALTEKEIKKSHIVLAKHDIYLETAMCYDRPCGKKIGEQQSFSASIGHDKQKAVDVAYAVLSEIYELSPETKLDITINQF